jgi:chromosome segregation ATPase
MSLEKLTALESRVRNLVQLVQDVKRENVTLKTKLSESQQQLRDQEQRLQDKENEQTDMQDRIEKILEELDVVAQGDEAMAACYVGTNVKSGGPS